MARCGICARWRFRPTVTQSTCACWRTAIGEDRFAELIKSGAQKTYDEILDLILNALPNP